MRVGIAADHGGFALKEQLVQQLRDSSHEVVDFGANSLALEDHLIIIVILMRERRDRDITKNV